MEFFTTGFYYLFSDDVKPIKQQDVLNSSTIIPIYTDVILDEDLHLENGWSLFTNVSFQLEKPDDVMDISSVLNTSIKEAIGYHLSNGLPMLDLIDIKIRKQGALLLQNKDYDLDLKNLEIKFHNQDYGFYTYTMYVCINLEYLNTLIKQVYQLK